MAKNGAGLKAVEDPNKDLESGEQQSLPATLEVAEEELKRTLPELKELETQRLDITQKEKDLRDMAKAIVQKFPVLQKKVFAGKDGKRLKPHLATETKLKVKLVDEDV